MSSFLSTLFRWLRGNIRWFGSAWPVLVPLGAITLWICIWLFLIPGRADNLIRYCGITMQLFGILFVAYGISKKSIQFGLPTFSERLKSWWDQHPRWPSTQELRPTTVSGTAGVSGGTSVSVGRGTVRGGPLEARLTAIEAHLDTQEDRQGKIEQQLNEEVKNRIKAQDSERDIHKSGMSKLGTKLHELGTGGLYIETIGVLLLFLGGILSTLSTEISGIST